MTGDVLTFDDFVRSRGRTLAHVAWLLTGRADDAEDLVQAALAKVVPRWEQVVAGGDPEAYVRRVIHTTYVSQGRRGRVRTLPWESAPPVAAEVEPLDARLDLLRALDALPPRQRAVLVLRLWEDRSERDTAELLGCSTGSVKTHLSRALSRLRELPSLQSHRAAPPAPHPGGRP